MIDLVLVRRAIVVIIIVVIVVVIVEGGGVIVVVGGGGAGADLVLDEPDNVTEGELFETGSAGQDVTRTPN